MSNKKYNTKSNKFQFVYTSIHSIYGIYNLMKEADDIAIDLYQNGDIKNFNTMMEVLIQYTNALSDLKDLYKEEKEGAINFSTIKEIEKDEPKIKAFQMDINKI